MNTIKNILFLGTVSIIILVQSCTPKALEIDIPQAESKLVISSQVIPNQFMIVTVSRSMDAQGFSEENGDTLNQDIINLLLVDSATVTISYNGIVDSLFSIPDAPGVYVSLNTPQFLNTNYNLYVKEEPTGDVVTSSAFMLQNVPLESASADTGSTAGIHRTTINFEFIDPPNEPNWYMVNFYAYKDSAQQNNNGEFSFEDDNNILKETIILKDVNFDNNTVNGSHIVEDWNQDTLFLSISNISEGYYEYLNARLRAGSLFTSISREPINYPTNITGGYGYFTTHKPSVEMVIVD